MQLEKDKITIDMVSSLKLALAVASWRHFEQNRSKKLAICAICVYLCIFVHMKSQVTTNIDWSSTHNLGSRWVEEEPRRKIMIIIILPDMIGGGEKNQRRLYRGSIFQYAAPSIVGCLTNQTVFFTVFVTRRQTNFRSYSEWCSIDQITVSPLKMKPQNNGVQLSMS